MNTFTISKTLNKNKVFILQKNALEKRLDPFFYVPELLELEKKVLAKKPEKLRDYVVSIASGSTPKRAEEEKYYSDAANGIPFLRVQNLSVAGILKLEKVKYINTETHNGLLKRSQVAEGDLLVKITGVGRMAIASVAPKGFIGNINQHVCVIKTKSRKVSETLASFLNSDIGEKLASRRSTGGTRPALDYPALLSIPIIEDERIVKIKKELVKQKTANEQKAEKLLASIDGYLLKELGIELPKKQENTIDNRMFVRSIKEVSGSRFDPFYHTSYFNEIENSIKSSIFKINILKNILSYIESGSRPKGGASKKNNGILSLGGEHVNNFCEIEVKKAKYIPFEYHQNIISTETKLNDIIFVKDGATTGKVGVINKNEYAKQNINEHVFLLRTIPIINTFYLVNYLNSRFAQIIIKKLITGATVTGITKDALKLLLIPLPPKEKQDEIANHITAIRKQAQALKDKTKDLIIKSNAAIERILLN